MNVEDFPLNRDVFFAINSRRHWLLDEFFKRFYIFGKGWFGIALAPVIYLLDKSLIIPYLIALILCGVVVAILKRTFRAKRPSASLSGVYILENLKLKSFPSGDSALAALIASSLFLCGIWQGVIYALIIGYGRVYMGVHYPLDVVVGWIIGSLCLVLSVLLLG
ncbi:MAG: phosphatase PAP2 family protein [Aquificaceae bacterium]|nr:phosphatase PAP2 family protein [Aquificaceae bacterium]